MFEKMKEDFDKFCKKVNETFGKVYSKLKKPKKKNEQTTLEDQDDKFVDIIEIPYKGKTYYAELWWNNKKGWYRAKTLLSEAQRFNDLKAAIIVDCPVRSRKRVERMMIERLDEYFEAERKNDNGKV